MGNACFCGPPPPMNNIVLVRGSSKKMVGVFSRHIVPVHETTTGDDSAKHKKNSVDTIRTIKVNTLVMSPKRDRAAERRNRNPEAPQQQETDGKHMNARGELTMQDKEIIARCWRKYISQGRRDLFHKTMLRCIEASPKLNEIIACGRYCYRDLTKWPKLNRICQAQFKFYERLIYELNMDERRMHEACTRLGETHAQYAQYGLKPHFLDIYQQSLLAIVAKLDIGDEAEREQCVQAFGRLSRFIIDVMMAAYGQAVAERRTNERRIGCREMEGGNEAEEREEEEETEGQEPEQRRW